MTSAEGVTGKGMRLFCFCPGSGISFANIAEQSLPDCVIAGKASLYSADTISLRLPTARIWCPVSSSTPLLEFFKGPAGQIDNQTICLGTYYLSNGSKNFSLQVGISFQVGTACQRHGGNCAMGTRSLDASAEEREVLVKLISITTIRFRFPSGELYIGAADET